MFSSHILCLLPTGAVQIQEQARPARTPSMRDGDGRTGGPPPLLPRAPQRGTSVRGHRDYDASNREQRTSSDTRRDAETANLPNLSPPLQQSEMGTRSPQDGRDYENVRRHVDLPYATDTSTDNTGTYGKTGRRGVSDVIRANCSCLAAALAVVVLLTTAGFTLTVFMHAQQEQDSRIKCVETATMAHPDHLDKSNHLDHLAKSKRLDNLDKATSLDHLGKANALSKPGYRRVHQVHLARQVHLDPLAHLDLLAHQAHLARPAYQFLLALLVYPAHRVLLAHRVVLVYLDHLAHHILLAHQAHPAVSVYPAHQVLLAHRVHLVV
ncbi:Hypp323 [Branchiostoma lanceolatum]|uniref:Hypp323 protein n=1 Tax=Branchiostoma lanceolatum TaxID=7740 RepID=A0A8J9WCR5_BRALA|nr:Hypp323 [Branchiostoma lanceolatum]